MNKYGVECFTIEKVEKCSADILNEKEKYWIEYYGSFKYGYNATKGGDGTQYADYDLIYSLYKENKTYSEIQELTGYDSKTIRHALIDKGISKEERAKNNNMHLYKKVAKIDLNSGEIIEIYPSINEAERQNGNSRHIADVCKGTRKTCKGFKWKYL